MEVEMLFLLRWKEIKDLNQDLAYLGIKFYVVFWFLTNVVREKSQAVLYLLLTLRFELFFHAIETIVELKETNEAADKLDFQKPFLFDFVISEIVVYFGGLSDNINKFFCFQWHFEVLFLNLNKHTRQFDILLDPTLAEKAEFEGYYYYASR